MSAGAALCRHGSCRRQLGRQVDGLPNLSFPCFGFLSSPGILSDLLEKDGPSLEPPGTLVGNGFHGGDVGLTLLASITGHTLAAR